MLNDSTAISINIYWNIVSSGGPIITQHHIMASPAIRKIKTALNLSFPTLNALHGRKVRFLSIYSYRIGQITLLDLKIDVRTVSHYHHNLFTLITPWVSRNSGTRWVPRSCNHTYKCLLLIGQYLPGCRTGPPACAGRVPVDKCHDFYRCK